MFMMPYPPQNQLCTGMKLLFTNGYVALPRAWL